MADDDLELAIGARIKELETQLRRESSASSALQSSNTELTAQLDNVHHAPCCLLVAYRPN